MPLGARLTEAELDMSIKVLWVEDEPNSMTYEVMLAEQRGWHITSAETASRALDLVRDRSFDLVVVDLILPQNNYEKERGHFDPYAGIHLIESVRQRTTSGHTPPDVPILVITAVVTDDLRARVLDKLESSRYYLNKPLEEGVYREVVRELTERLDRSPQGASQAGPSLS